MESTPRHLFVYGTLMRNSPSPYAKLLHMRADFVGTGSIAGRLYNLGSFPGAVPDETSTLKVHGEVYFLKVTALLETLDRYEGCHSGAKEPQIFKRETACVTLMAGPVLTAWVYALIPARSGRPRIATGKFRAPVFLRD